MGVEKHHVIPLSIGGMDIPENILKISTENHKKIHQTLNIPYGAIRSLRKIENNLGVDNKKVENIRLGLQKKYFARLFMLEPFLIHAQVSKLLEQIAWLRKEYTRLKEENIRLKAQLELLKNLMK